MLCQNCGIKTTKPNQKFCKNCGKEIKTTSEAPQLSTQNAQPTQDYAYFPPVAKNKGYGPPGPHSIKSLGFGLLSVGLFIVGLVISYGTIIYLMFQRTPLFPSGPNIIGSIGIFTLLCISIHIIGTMTGFISRGNFKKAHKGEPINKVEQIGYLAGNGGIGSNIFGIVLVIFLLFTFVPALT